MTTIEKKATEAVPASEEGTAVIADAGLVAGVSSITKDTLAEYEQAEIVKNDLEKTRAAADREEVQKDNEQENQEIEEQKIEENKEDEVVELKKTIETQKIQLEEQEDRLKRVAAEFENYKKRSTKERETLYNSLKGDVILTILPVVDNLEKAVVAKTEDESYKQGIELVLKQLKDVLTSNGVKEIETIGKTFDPELHEAVASVVDENLGEKEIKEEYRKGYKIGSKVIRHSMVVVAN